MLQNKGLNMDVWKMMDAKVNLSKIAKLAKTNGPQLITMRGEPDCVIISYDDYKKLEKVKDCTNKA